MKNYIIAIEDRQNQVSFQGMSGQFVENPEKALPFAYPPHCFVKNMRDNGLQPTVFRDFGTPEQIVVDI